MESPRRATVIILPLPPMFLGRGVGSDARPADSSGVPAAVGEFWLVVPRIWPSAVGVVAGKSEGAGVVLARGGVFVGMVFWGGSDLVEREGW